jgi:hypothetical protein
MVVIDRPLLEGICLIPTALLHHDVILLVKIHITFRADPAVFGAVSRHQVPAGNRKVEDCRTTPTMLFSTIADFPTRGYGEKLLDAGNVEAIIGQQTSQTFEPLKVVVGIEALATTSGRFDQPFLFVNAQCTWVNVQKLGHDTDGIEPFDVGADLAHYDSPESYRLYDTVTK